MSILSGFLKTKRYRKLADGYKLQSEWTSASSVEHADGMNAEEKIQDIEDKKINITDMVDNLESTATDLPLSANMGRELNDKIEKVETVQLLSTVTLRRQGKFRQLFIEGEITGSNGHFTTFVIPETDRPSANVRGFGLSVEQGYIRIGVDSSGYVFTVYDQQGIAGVVNASGSIYANIIWLVD